MGRWLALLCLAWAFSTPATSLVLAAGDNITPPLDDPGWSNIGFRASNTTVYLGNGWVVSAAHVGQGQVWYYQQNITYLDAPRPAIVLDNTPSGPQAEVKLWRLMADPGLPSLTVGTVTPSVGDEVVLIARGRDRGDPVFWPPYNGWAWGSGGPVRWGTNRVSETGIDSVNGPRTTRSMRLRFSLDGDTSDEAMAAAGDSGGAVFRYAGSQWELAGVLWGIAVHVGQPGNWAVDGNDTFAADLAWFASDIAAVTAERACSDGTDDDGDGLIDYPDDPGCSSASDPFETDAVAPCDDGFDNDGDGLRDMADPGCATPGWPWEDPACDDELDNDGDGKIDWDGGSGGATPDPQCGEAYWNRESPSQKRSCGLGFELVFLAPLFARLGRRRRQPG